MPFQPDYEVPAERRAYFLPGAANAGPDGVGVLMLHGFMGSPVSSRPMADFLSRQGVTVACPLLPGHGNLPYMIHGVHRRAWLAEAEEALARLRPHCDQIFLMGHSMGAVLGAHLASRHPDMCGLIMLAPLYDVPDWKVKLVAIGRYFMKWYYPLKSRLVERDVFVGRVLDFNPDIDPEDPALQDWLVEASRLPVDGLDEMRKMAVLGRRLWPRLRLPVLIFQGGSDPAVSPGNTEKLFQRLAAPDKEMRFFPQVGHELMRPVEPIHRKVWHKVLEFILDHTAPDAAAEPPVLSGRSILK